MSSRPSTRELLELALGQAPPRTQRRARRFVQEINALGELASKVNELTDESGAIELVETAQGVYTPRPPRTASDLVQELRRWLRSR